MCGIGKLFHVSCSGLCCLLYLVTHSNLVILIWVGWHSTRWNGSSLWSNFTFHLICKLQRESGVVLWATFLQQPSRPLTSPSLEINLQLIFIHFYILPQRRVYASHNALSRDGVSQDDPFDLTSIMGLFTLFLSNDFGGPWTLSSIICLPPFLRRSPCHLTPPQPNPLSCMPSGVSHSTGV